VKLLTVSQNGGSTIIIIIIISNRGKENKIETKSISLGSNRLEQLLYLENKFLASN
jgi:hypothetical protein